MESPLPNEPELIERIANAARRVVQARTERQRDVHPKQHGCVAATLRIENVPEALQHGWLREAGDYDAIVRFSNSSKRPQSDEVADGRGIAVKLWRAGEVAPAETHDLILLNGPAFFARDVRDMVEVAEREASDRFPGSFFLGAGRLRGLRAFLAMAVTKVRSPLDLTYFSQTPYGLGTALDRPGDPVRAAVKYRLRPLDPTSAFDAKNPRLATGNHLHYALRADLARRAYRFELAVQPWRSEADAIEDATVIWSGPFQRVGELTIPMQNVFGAHWELAEKLAFSPWNQFPGNRPLGSLNRARKAVYDASRAARNVRNNGVDSVLVPSDGRGHHAARAALLAAEAQPFDPKPLAKPGAVTSGVRAVRGLFPDLLASAAKRASLFAYGLAGLLLMLGVFYSQCAPAKVLQPLTIPLIDMPSEAAIPGVKRSAKHAHKSERELADDPVWQFRYAPIGAELYGGIPYWIYRVLPTLFPRAFEPEGDWSTFGLIDDPAGHAEFYESYHELPPGVVLSDSVLHVAGNAFKIPLKRVSFNCATCHRGKVTIDGANHYVDGMPNIGIDTARYKEVVFGLMRRNDFTADRVIAAIDELLAREGGSNKRLTQRERAMYRLIVSESRRQAFLKPLEWMKTRPQNGFGRLDAFGALRFEFLSYDPRHDDTIATVDLPSIWNQRAEFRPHHHYDGNTDNVRARNFGATVGVGGREMSLHRDAIERIGAWIDELQPPTFAKLARTERASQHGERVFDEHCASCHGKVNPDGSYTAPSAQQTYDAGTDALRRESIDDEYVDKLNQFGMRAGLWPSTAFSSAKDYLAPPLDGIWLRAPYLHNGSVPTLEALLDPVDERPTKFCRGTLVYDAKSARQVLSPLPCAQHAEFDTSQRGNRNTGHEHFVPEADRAPLIDYLMTL